MTKYQRITLVISKKLQEFDGNVQEGSTVYDSLKPTRCRYVRICPVSWSEKVALRAELYGYEAGTKIV